MRLTIIVLVTKEGIKLDVSTVLTGLQKVPDKTKESWGIYSIKYIKKQEFQFTVNEYVGIRIGRWD